MIRWDSCPVWSIYKEGYGSWGRGCLGSSLLERGIKVSKDRANKTGKVIRKGLREQNEKKGLVGKGVKKKNANK